MKTDSRRSDVLDGVEMSFLVTHDLCEIRVCENGLQFEQRFDIEEVEQARQAFRFYGLLGVNFSQEVHEAVHHRYNAIGDYVNGWWPRMDGG